MLDGSAQISAGQRTGLTPRTEATKATETSPAADGGQDGNSPTAGIVPSGLALKETFLTLLVAQIKNQNPLNPSDGTEFLSQLAQFTQVEQLISIREELETMGQQNQALSAAANGISAR